jgi:DivIVA domain-containing protein
MKLTSKDIRSQEFEKVLRGYDPSDVRAFLNVVAQEWDHATRRLHEIDTYDRGASMPAPSADAPMLLSVEDALADGVRTLLEQRREALTSMEERLVSLAESLGELKRGQDALHALLDDMERRRDAALREMAASPVQQVAAEDGNPAPAPASPSTLGASAPTPGETSEQPMTPASHAATHIDPSRIALVDQILLELD